VHSNETHRHHHLICNICHKVLEVQDDLWEDLESGIEKQYKFKILDHSLKFFGVCDECQKKLSDE
jgi:Fur family ferric uptake transcriptional regulator